MATSAARTAGPVISKPLMGFVVGKYFELRDGLPDYNGIDRNIEAAIETARKLIEAGFLVFTPHLNTHHFEMKTRIHEDPVKNEDFYRAFDRKLLAKMDFVYASPNAWNSSGGRLEMQLASHLGVPIFWNLRDLCTWALGKSEPYATITYDQVSEEALHFGEDDVKVVLVDGPHWAMDGVELDVDRVTRNEKEAENHAIELFNARLAAFTPHQNASFRRLGFRMPTERYHALNREVLTRVADGLFLLPGWEDVPECQERVRQAKRLGKPAFASKNELVKWRDGRTDWFAVDLHE
jgi:hypothetical protein